MRLCVFPWILSLLSATHAFSDLSSARHGSCPTPSVVEIWKPAITVTEWTTHTAYASCVECDTLVPEVSGVYETSKQTPSVTTSTTALWSNTAAPKTTQTLYPTTHWEHDSSNPDHIVPSNDTQTYYGPVDQAGAETAHNFQWINATLTLPAVVLDHSTLLSYSWSNSSQTLSIQFTSNEAYKIAQTTWNTSMILVAYTEGCGNYEGGDSCYIEVKSLSFDATTESCKATGTVQTLKECLHSMNASWGQYIPAKGTPSPSSRNGESITSSIYSSVLSKYPSYSSDLSSYMSAYKYGGSNSGYTGAGISVTNTAAPTKGHGTSYAATRSNTIPVSTTGGMQYGGYQSNQYATESATITAASTTKTSLSPSVSRISNSLSSYLSSLSASYASSSSSLISSTYTSFSGTAPSSTASTESTTGTATDSTSPGISTSSTTGTGTGSGTMITPTSFSSSITSSDRTSSTGSGNSDGSLISTTNGESTTSTFSDTTTTSNTGVSSTSGTSEGSAPTSTISSTVSTSTTSGTNNSFSSRSSTVSSTTSGSSDTTPALSSSFSDTSVTSGVGPDTSGTGFTTPTSSSSSSIETTTTTTTTTSSSTTTTASVSLPTCIDTLPSSCSNLKFYDGDDLFGPMLGCSTDLYSLSQTGQISDGSLQPAYHCFASIDSTSLGSSVVNCVEAAVACGGIKTTITTTTTTTTNGVTTTTTSTTSSQSTAKCTQGVDPTYGLPTYCIGPDFDSYLDSIDGILTLSQTDFAKLVQLFPNIFSSLTRRFYDNKLHKRCGWDDWSDCVDQVTNSIEDGAGQLTSAIDSLAGGAASSLSSAFAAITSAANNIQDAAASRGQELSNEAAQAIAELENGLNRALSFDQSGHINVNIAPPDNAKVDSPWGSQVLIHSFGHGGAKSEEEGEEGGARRLVRKESDFSLNVFCVDCSITGSIDIHGTLSIDTDGIHELSIRTDVSEMEVNLGIGLDAKAEWSQTFTVNLFQQGIPDLCSGTTLCIGPYVKMDAELTLGVESEGYLLAGGKWTFTDAYCELNAYEGGQSQNNWLPAFESNINAGGEVTLTATVGVPLSVGVGVTVLNGAISKDISIEVKPTVTGEAQAAVDITHDGSGTTVDGSVGDCDGIYVSSYWQVVLSYNILDLKEGDLYDTGEQPIADKCIPWDAFLPVEDNANGNSNTGFGDGGGTGSAYATSAMLVDRADRAPLQICNDGNVYRVPFGVTLPGCSTNWLAYASPQTVNAAFAAAFASLQKQILDSIRSGHPWLGATFPNLNDVAINAATVIAAGSRQIPIMFPEYIDRVSVSRFRIVNTNQVPAKSEYIAFDYVDQTHGRVAHDLSGNKFSAVACAKVGDVNAATMNQVFLVPYMAENTGLSLLSSGLLTNTVSNGLVTDCRVMTLDMVR